jgi:signal transduction histidine kinase
MRIYLFLFFTSILFQSVAQNKSLDSLKTKLSKTNGITPTAADLNLKIGLEYSNISNFQKSLSHLSTAANHSKALKDTATLIKSLSAQGRLYSDKGENPKALRLFQQALNLAEKSKDLLYIAYTKKDIGVLYISWKKFDGALKYYDEALEQGLALNDGKLVADCYNNKATVYEQLNQYTKALEYYTKALKYYLQTGQKRGIAKCYSNIAIVLKAQKKFSQAISYNQKSLKIIQSIGDKWMEAATLNNIGSVYYSMGNFKNTLLFCERSLKIARSIQAKEIEVACYETLADAASALKQYKLAYYYEAEFHKISQEFLNADQTKQFSELEIKYKTEKKEQQIALLQKQSIIQKLSIGRHRTTIGITIGITLGIIIISVLLFNRGKLQQLALYRQQELQQRELITQAIISAEENERKRIGSDLHDGVGQLLSAAKMNFAGLIDRNGIPKEKDKFLAEKTLALLDESCKEVRSISHQMMPNALLKSGIAADIRDFIEKLDAETLKIDLKITGFKDNLEGNEEIILYRVIQESINNVIKHSGASHLSITLEKTINSISVIIADNGKGFDTTIGSEGIGLKNIRTRVEYLKGNVNFITSPGNGTTVNVYIPW